MQKLCQNIGLTVKLQLCKCWSRLELRASSERLGEVSTKAQYDGTAVSKVSVCNWESIWLLGHEQHVAIRRWGQHVLVALIFAKEAWITVDPRRPQTIAK